MSAAGEHLASRTFIFFRFKRKKMQIESVLPHQKKASTLSVLFSTKSTLAGG